MRSQKDTPGVDGATLAQTAIFEGLPDDVLSELARLFWQESYSHGATIFKEGDPADRAFLLRDGSVTLVSPRMVSSPGELEDRTNQPPLGGLSLLRPQGRPLTG